MSQSQKSSNLVWITLFLCWLTAMIATLGSLFFSEVMLLPTLCYVLVSAHLYVPIGRYFSRRTFE